MKFFKLTLISFILSLLVFSASAQSSNLLSSKDLSTFKVDALTDAEIAQLQQQLKQAGLTIDQVEQQAMAKGMSSAEFAKLRAKLSSTVLSNTNKSPLNKLETKTTTNNNLNTNNRPQTSHRRQNRQQNRFNYYVSENLNTYPNNRDSELRIPNFIYNFLEPILGSQNNTYLISYINPDRTEVIIKPSSNTIYDNFSGPSDYINVNGTASLISFIGNNTFLQVKTAFPSSNTSSYHNKVFPIGAPIPFTNRSTRYINVPTSSSK